LSYFGKAFSVGFGFRFQEKFDAFVTALKTHKPDEKFPWTEELAKQWILPNLCSFSQTV
jgi:hypothetical protein